MRSIGISAISSVAKVATGFIISAFSRTHRRSIVLLPLRCRIKQRLSLRGFVSKSGQPNQGDAYHRCTVGEPTLRHIGTFAFASRRHHPMSGCFPRAPSASVLVPVLLMLVPAAGDREERR